MASRRYNTYKFLYTDDYGRQSIKRQRAYKDTNGQEVTPITPLFLARTVPINERVEGTSRDLRHLLAYIGTEKFKAFIPYSPSTEVATLRAHLLQILAVSRVICGDYYGESNNQAF